MKNKLVVAVLVSLVGLGGAKASSAPSHDKAKAKKLYRQGKSFYKRGKYIDAVKAFKGALRHRSHKVILFNIALCYAMLNRKLEAATYGRRYLKQATAEERVLPKVLQSAMSAVGVVLVRAPDPAAEIYLDGKLAGKGRVDTVVMPGRRKVEVKLDGVVVAKRILRVNAGRDVVWDISNLPRPRRLTPRPEPPNGPKDGAKRRGVHWAWFTTLAVVAAGLATGAGVMSLKAKQAHDDFLADRTDGSLREDGLRFETTANVLWGVAAAGAVTAVVLAIFTRWRGAKKERAAAVRISPALSPDGAGLTLTWRR